MVVVTMQDDDDAMGTSVLTQLSSVPECTDVLYAPDQDFDRKRKTTTVFAQLQFQAIVQCPLFGNTKIQNQSSVSHSNAPYCSPASRLHLTGCSRNIHIPKTHQRSKIRCTAVQVYAEHLCVYT